jgi:hypothetical protein
LNTSPCRSRADDSAPAQRIRKRVEEIVGWAKTLGGLRPARHIGQRKTGQQALVVGAAYNLLRLVACRRVAVPA